MYYEYLYSTDAGFGNLLHTCSKGLELFKYIKYGCQCDTAGNF